VVVEVVWNINPKAGVDRGQVEQTPSMRANHARTKLAEGYTMNTIVPKKFFRHGR